jgi:hypothetical protein
MQFDEFLGICQPPECQKTELPGVQSHKIIQNTQDHTSSSRAYKSGVECPLGIPWNAESNILDHGCALIILPGTSKGTVATSRFVSHTDTTMTPMTTP